MRLPERPLADCPGLFLGFEAELRPRPEGPVSCLGGPNGSCLVRAAVLLAENGKCRWLLLPLQIFENKGAMMGCSNPHPHCQVRTCVTHQSPAGLQGLGGPSAGLSRLALEAGSSLARALRMRLLGFWHGSC